MLLDIGFVNLWGVLQLVLLGSLGRTIRVRTVLFAMATGVFVCAPLAALLEHAWAAGAGSLIGRPAEAVVAVAGYTVDPFLELLILLSPLTALLLLPVVRRQWSITDCVLVGAATGAGFGLAEDLYRFGSMAGHATAIDGGWLVPARSWVGASHVGYAFVPDVSTTLGAWLPDIGAARLLPPSVWTFPNVLLIWSAIGGFGVGLWLHRSPLRWTVGVAALLFAAVDHAAFNADITLGPRLLLAPFRALRELAPALPAAALGMAAWMDRRRMGRPGVEHLLADERIVSPRWLGTLRAALSRPPGSLLLVGRLVRLRRAYRLERSRPRATTESLWLALTSLRDDVDRQLSQPPRWRWMTLGERARQAGAAGGPRLLVRLALTSPFVFWFVLGGWPATAGVQRALSAGSGRVFVVTVSLVAQCWLAWRVLGMLRGWRRFTQPGFADTTAAFVLQTTAAGGALGLGAYGLVQAFGAWPTQVAGATAHAIDAIDSLRPEQTLPMANGGPALPRPGGEAPEGAPRPAERTSPEGPSPPGDVAPASMPLLLPAAPLLANAPEAALAAGATAGTIALAGAAAGAGMLGAATAVDHAGEVDAQPDPDILSPPGGLSPPGVLAPTIPAPAPGRTDPILPPAPPLPPTRDGRTLPAPPTGTPAGDAPLPQDWANPTFPPNPLVPNIPEPSFPDD